MRKIAFSCFLACAGLSGGVNAEETQGKTDVAVEKPNIPPPGWSNGEFLGPRWWIKNPKNLPEVPDHWLYHADLRYAYGEQGGNVEVSSHNGEAELFLRKSLLTSITTYKVNKRDTDKKLTGASVSSDNQAFRQALRYPLTDNLTLAGRYVWERNSDKYIEERTMWYAGLRYYAIKQPQYNLFLGAYYGPHTSTSYLSSQIQSIAKFKDFPDVEAFDSDSLYFGAQFDWQITDTISFEHDLEYMKFLEQGDYYFLRLDNKLKFQFSKQTSFFVSYLMDIDDNPFVDAVQTYMDGKRAQNLPYGEMETTDTTLTVGVQFSF